MRKHPFVLSSICLALALTGCGSSNSNSDEEIDVVETPTSKTITVIDGYLSDVTVCADVNNNQSCDDGEELGSTDENGQFTVASEYADYALIAKVTAGTATDADALGVVTNSYEMITDADSTVITPFTTLAVTSEQTMAELAATLNLPEDLIAGDYVAAKSSADTAYDATVTHAIARSLVEKLSSTVVDTDADSLLADAVEVVVAVEDYITDNGTDELDSVTLVEDEDESYVTETIVSDLGEALETQGEWRFGSTNTAHLQDEGIRLLTFIDGVSSLYTSDGTLKLSGEYSTHGSVLTSGSGDDAESDTFFYISSDLLLSVAGGSTNDLTFFYADSADNNSYSLSSVNADDLVDQTWYDVMDDSDSETVDLQVVKMQFSELDENGEGTITMNELGETDTTDMPYNFSQVSTEWGELTQFTIELTDEVVPMEYLVLYKNDDIMFLYETNRDKLEVYVKDKSLAQAIIVSVE